MATKITTTESGELKVLKYTAIIIVAAIACYLITCLIYLAVAVCFTNILLGGKRR